PAPHNNMGIIRQAQGRWQEALEFHQRAAQLQPTMLSAHNNAGNVLKQLGKPAEAFDAYRRALALDENNAATLYLLGVLTLEHNRLDMAAKFLEAAYRLAPRDVRVIAQLWSVFGLIGRFPEAVELAKQVIAAMPQAATGYHMLAFMQCEMLDYEGSYAN